MRAKAAFGAMDALEREAKHLGKPNAIRHASTKMELAFGRLKAMEKYSDELLHKGSKRARDVHQKLRAAKLRQGTEPATDRGGWQRTTEYRAPARQQALVEVPGGSVQQISREMLGLKTTAKGIGGASKGALPSMQWQMQRNLPP